MTQAERDGLRLSMRQVWHHCVAPVVARAIDQVCTVGRTLKAGAEVALDILETPATP